MMVDPRCEIVGLRACVLLLPSWAVLKCLGMILCRYIWLISTRASNKLTSCLDCRVNLCADAPEGAGLRPAVAEATVAEAALYSAESPFTAEAVARLRPVHLLRRKLLRQN